MDKTSSDGSSNGDDKLEYQKHFQVGRMSMLFGLVDSGKISLDDAADYTGMTWGEAADMFQGWKESQRM